MKHFISKKIFLLLIYFFQIVLNKTPFQNIKRPFKPFISVLSPESLKQFEKVPEKKQSKFLQKKEHKPFISVLSPDSMKQFLVEEDDSSKEDIVSFQVKCMYIDDYSIYDISGLGINKFKEGVSAYNETIDDTTIYYNFCYDLKDINIDGCGNVKKRQMVAVTDEKGDKKCHNISKSINKGNKWSKLKNTTDNTTVLKIKVNSEDEYHNIYYMLKCNKTLKRKEKKFIKENSYYYNDKNETVLYFETREACKKADFYIIWKFINDFEFIFALIIIAFGFFNCILGQKLAKYTSFLLTLFAVVVFVLIVSQFILPSGCYYWIIWVMLVIGIILGFTAGYFFFKYHEKFLSFLVGGLGGFLLGEFLFNLFGNLINGNPTLIHILFILICIIVCIVLAYFIRDYIIIFATSFIGAYALIRGISLLLGHFPSEYTVIDLKKRGEKDQLKDLITWRVYVYLAFIIIAFGLSVYIQIKINKKIKKKKEGEEAPDENLNKELKNK